MRKKLAVRLLLLSCCCALAAGCRGGGGGASNSAQQGGEVDAVVSDVDKFTEEILQKVGTARDPSAGVDEAQKLLDSRKAELTARISAARGSRQFGESEGARGKLLESEVGNTDRVARLRTQYIDLWMRDAAFKSKLDRLVGDYKELFGE